MMTQQNRPSRPTFLPTKDFIFKSLRVDEHCFFVPFIEGAIWPNKKMPLRKLPKKSLTVTGQTSKGAIFRRTNFFNNDPRQNLPLKEPQYGPEIKQGFSKPQSASLGLVHFFPKVFGFANRFEALVGVMFDEEDVLYGDRNCIKDFGSVKRPYDAFSLREADRYCKSQEGKLYAAEEIGLFKNAIILPENRNFYNEVMVRLRWNIHSSKVFIGSNTLIARFWAQELARQIKKYLLANKLCDEKYVVPICFYLPDHELNFCEYTQDEQLCDRNEESRYFETFRKTREGHISLLMLPTEQLLANKAYLINEMINMLAAGNVHIFQFLNEKIGSDFLFKEFHALLARKPREFSQFEAKVALHQKLYDVLYHALRTHDHHLEQIILDYCHFSNLAPAPGSPHSLLLVAVSNNLIGWTKALLEKSKYLNVNEQAPYHQSATPLMIALQYGFNEIAQSLLLHQNINLNLTDKNGKTAIYYAAENGNLEMVTAILESKSHCAMQHIEKAFLIAVLNGHDQVMEKFLYYLKPQALFAHAPELDGNSPIRYALKGGHRHLVETLLRHHVFLEAIQSHEKDAMQLLFELASDGDEGLFQAVLHMLITSKAQFNQHKEANLQMLLGQIVQNKQAKLLPVVCIAGAKVNDVLPQGLTPLMWAVLLNGPDLIAELIKQGADPGLVSPVSLARLSQVAKRCGPEIKQHLLECINEAKARTGFLGGLFDQMVKMSPTFLAERTGNEEIKRSLAEKAGIPLPTQKFS